VLEVDDVIVAMEFEGLIQPIRIPSELLDFVLFRRPNDNITIHYYRAGVLNTSPFNLGTRS
jgi:hypothetical protein